jgi:hypothetical protein
MAMVCMISPVGGFPQPVADLIVEGDGFLRCVDMDVVAQPIEELGAVRLRIDRLHPDMFPENAPLGARRFRVDVHPLIGLPHTGQATQRAKIGQRIWREIGFGEDVVKTVPHGFPICIRRAEACAIMGLERTATSEFGERARLFFLGAASLKAALS